MLLLLAICGAVLLATATPAGAHATLETLSPEPDAVLDTPPTEVVLTFSEPISIPQDAIRVFDPSGRRLPGVEATADANVMTAKLPELTVDGSYTVAWHMVSADGHALSGAYLFHLGKATLTEPVDAATGGVAAWPSAVRAFGSVLAIGSLVALLGLVAGGAGGSATATGEAAGDGRRRRGRVISLVWAGAFVGTLISLFGSAEAVGSTLADGLDVALSTSTGRVSAVACALALVGLVVSRLRPPPMVHLVLGLLAVAAIALEGHAVALSPVALSASLTVLHVLAAVTWGAGLFWLEQRTRTIGPEQLRTDVERRSPWAIGAVLLLVVTGTVLVLDRVGIGQLLTSWYGRIAVVKLVLLGVAILLALRNRFSLAPELPVSSEATDSGDAAASDEPLTSDGSEFDEPVRRLRVSVRLEMVVLAVALVAGAALAQIAPPAEGANGGSFIQRAPFGDGEVELTVEPGARGVNEVHVTALGTDGRLMPGLEDLALSLSLATDNIGPLTPQMQIITSGHSVSYARFPFKGEWTVLVTAKVGKFEALSATFTVPIGP